MSDRKFKCQYCGYTGSREQLVTHIEKEHEDLIPENFTAARLVFNNINHKDHGVCVVCKRETPWNEKTWKYARLCGRPSCAKAIRATYTNNMVKADRPLNMLDDPDHQQKMLAARSISGEYTFSDKGKRTYTGSFERKFLEFLDKVLEIPSSDIISPGPVFEYDFEGSKHKWITDVLYIPFNLVIEIKDGGSNPNTRQMDSYRAKQVAKEKMITNLGTYNYLRLTNNDFEQFLLVLAELKMQMLDDSIENSKVIIRINEEVGGIPPASSSHDGYVVAYTSLSPIDKDDVEGFGFVRSIYDEKILLIDENLNIKSAPIKFLENRMYSFYKFNGDMNKKYNTLLNDYTNKKIVSENYFYELLSESDTLSIDQIKYDNTFTLMEDLGNRNVHDIQYYSLLNEYKHSINKIDYIDIINPRVIEEKNEILQGNKIIDILEDVNGYFAMNTLNHSRSRSYTSINEISEFLIKTLLEGIENKYE